MYSGTTPQNCRCLGPCFTVMGSKLDPSLFCLLKKFSVLSKNKKKATVVPKEAPMLAMKALELRKK